MFISPAYAQAAGGGEGSLLMSLLPLVLIFAVFWFLLIRPQQKKMKEHREMVGSLRRHDEVVTGGGFVGTVRRVIDDTYVIVRLADGVDVKVVRGTIAEVLGKGGPATKSKKAARDEDEDDEDEDDRRDDRDDDRDDRDDDADDDRRDDDDTASKKD